MTTIRCNDNWVQFNQCFQNNEEEEEDDEEALSLCDLPTNDHEIDTNSNNKQDNFNDQEDFDFGSCHGAAACRSPENMCTADEVFFQGQILPLRHSVINRSASMSSTIRSNGYGYKYKPRIRNQFHSHPSPSPRIRTQGFRTLSQPSPKTSSLWSFLQVGLVKPQEIGLSDLKNRSKRFGSHNSSNSSSTSSSMNSTTDQNQNQNNTPTENHRKNIKKKQRLFFGGCKCSANSIERTIRETVPKKKTTKVEENFIIGGERKEVVTRHRTFEWLKQLSIAAAAAAPSEA